MGNGFNATLAVDQTLPSGGSIIRNGRDGTQTGYNYASLSHNHPFFAVFSKPIQTKKPPFRGRLLHQCLAISYEQ